MAAVLVAAAMEAGETAHARQAEERLGVDAIVLSPEGLPVSAGTVTLESPGAVNSAPIGRDGRFRLVPHAAGPFLMIVDVPDFAPYRIRFTVPPSRAVTLPPIRLASPTYLRVRFTAPGGEAIAAPRVFRTSVDGSGTPIREAAGRLSGDRVEADGTAVLGPLPRGVTMMSMDLPPFARMRLPDVLTPREPGVIDGGTVAVEPGASLQVEVVDGDGAPVPDHAVYLEEAAPFSPLQFPEARSDANGRAAFERVAGGSYRLRTLSIGPCGGRPLVIARSLNVTGSGVARTRLTIGGVARLRFMSGGVPVPGMLISATPESAAAQPPRWMRGASGSARPGARVFRPLDFESPCLGTTDRDGRVTLTNFPAGPVRLDVRRPNSIWVDRAQVPAGGREVVIDVPDGVAAVRVLGGDTGGPVSGASIAWISRGARTEARTTATGDALLEGIAPAPGTLAVRAAGYAPRELKLQNPPDGLHEVTLSPVRDASLVCRVVDEADRPVPGAVVELAPDDPIQTGHIAVSDDDGVARFADPPFGLLRATAYVGADASASAPVSAGAAQVVLTLRAARRKSQ